MRKLCVLALLPCLAACATASDRYPSLAIRDVERAQGQFEPAPAAPLDVPEVAVPQDGTLAQQLDALQLAAAESHEAFLASAPRAANLANAANGAAVTSNAWASAQIALADLDSQRSQTTIALADLDTLMVARAVQGEDVSSIETVRQTVLATLDNEDNTLASLRARVR